MYMYVCMYIYIYIYTHTYTYVGYFKSMKYRLAAQKRELKRSKWPRMMHAASARNVTHARNLISLLRSVTHAVYEIAYIYYYYTNDNTT